MNKLDNKALDNLEKIFVNGKKSRVAYYCRVGREDTKQEKRETHQSIITKDEFNELKQKYEFNKLKQKLNK